jgi:flavin reductase (DIM6/NTAB) family NADH-FMN oxidoreductase RutF
MLASWVMQAGFEPPMVTVAMAPGRDLLEAVEAGTPFVVNVLGENQRALLARFGKPAAAGEEPFAGLAVSRAGCGAPKLDEAAAWLECGPVSQTAGSDATPSDHVVVLARVIAAGTGGELAPLVHLRKNGLRY